MHNPVIVNGTAVESVQSTKFMDVHVSNNLPGPCTSLPWQKKGSLADTLSAATEEGSPQPIHPHHLLQGYRRVCVDQCCGVLPQKLP